MTSYEKLPDGTDADRVRPDWRVGQVIRQRVGLHRSEDSRMRIVAVTPTSVRMTVVNGARGRRRVAGKVFSVAIARVNAVMEPADDGTSGRSQSPGVGVEFSGGG